MFAMIMLHQEGSRKTCYDYNSGDYLQYIETSQNSDINSILWLFIQPFVIFQLEVLGDILSSYSILERAVIGIATFLLGVVTITVLWEKKLLVHYGRYIERESVKIAEPPDAVLRQWAQYFPRRIRNARRLAVISVLVIVLLCTLYVVTGVSPALPLALCVYCAAYAIWASARPVLLKKYMKEKLGTTLKERRPA